MCAAIGNPQTTFLNACTQGELDALFALIQPKLYRWHRMEAQRPAIEALRGIHMHDTTGTIVQVTQTGKWWMDWSQCFVFYPGAAPAPVVPPGAHQVMTLARCPVGVRSSTFNTWIGNKANVKVMAHVVAWKSRNLATPVPHDLGRGSSVSHLCDTSSCCRREHLLLAAAHLANMDRQRCRGVLLVCVEGLIIRQERCPHDSTNNFGESCRRIHAIFLDNVKGDPDKIMGITPQDSLRTRIQP